MHACRPRENGARNGGDDLVGLLGQPLKSRGASGDPQGQSCETIRRMLLAGSLAGSLAGPATQRTVLGICASADTEVASQQALSFTSLRSSIRNRLPPPAIAALVVVGAATVVVDAVAGAVAVAGVAGVVVVVVVAAGAADAAADAAAAPGRCVRA